MRLIKKIGTSERCRKSIIIASEDGTTTRLVLVGGVEKGRVGFEGRFDLIRCLLIPFCIVADCLELIFTHFAEDLQRIFYSFAYF